MAKEQFTRSKPHVNVALLPKLVQLGFTPNGAYQILHGLVVTDLQDRERIAETFSDTHLLHYRITMTKGS